MKKICLVLCLMCMVSSLALAQGKTNVQWKCDKPSDQQSIPVGDKPGHAYANPEKTIFFLETKV